MGLATLAWYVPAQCPGSEPKALPPGDSHIVQEKGTMGLAVHMDRGPGFKFPSWAQLVRVQARACSASANSLSLTLLLSSLQVSV